MILEISAILVTSMLMIMFIMYDITQLRASSFMRKILAGQISIFLWCLFLILELLAPNPDVKNIYILLQRFVFCAIAFLIYRFIENLLPARDSNNRVYCVLGLIGFILATLRLVDGIVDLGLREFLQRAIFIYFILGILLFTIFLSISHILERTQKVMYFFTIAITPLYIFTVMWLRSLGMYSSLTIGFMPVYFVIFIWAAKHFRLYDPMPTILKAIVANTDHGIIVLNQQLDIVEYNRSLINSIVDIRNCKDIRQLMGNLKQYASNQELIEQLLIKIESADAKYSKSELDLEFEGKELFLVLYYCAILKKNKQKIATLITVRNVTEQIMIQRNIESNNTLLEKANEHLRQYLEQAEVLSAEAERENIMREINKIFGHTMTEILTLVEVDNVLLEQEEDDGTVVQGIDDTLQRARLGLKEIRGLVAKYKQGADTID